MPASINRHRGPRFIPAKPMRNPKGKRILFAQLIGLVVRAARSAIGVTQQDIALWLSLPISTVSKLERGDTTMAVYHLDALAQALSHFARKSAAEDWVDEIEGDNEADDDEDDDPEEPAWEGWELMKVASLIADDLDAEGYAVFWAPPKTKGPKDATPTYVKGAGLALLVKEFWPEEYEDRI